MHAHEIKGLTCPVPYGLYIGFRFRDFRGERQSLTTEPPNEILLRSLVQENLYWMEEGSRPEEDFTKICSCRFSCKIQVRLRSRSISLTIQVLSDFRHLQDEFVIIKIVFLLFTDYLRSPALLESS